MSESLLRSDILSWAMVYADGHANAVPRKKLLAHLCSLGHWPRPDATSDRAMRKQYETMEQIGSCGKGIFFIRTADDRREAQGQLHGRAMSELVHEKRIRDAAPAGQMALFAALPDVPKGQHLSTSADDSSAPGSPSEAI